MWHGYADILVGRCSIKVGTADDKKERSGEALLKKMRTEGSGDDESSTSDELYSCDSLDVEVKNDTFNSGNTMSNVLSQTIVNAFAEVNKNPEFSRSYIPSFYANSEAIRITMYNCGLDSLILSDNLDIFIRDQGKTILDITTILSVWYALNFESYIDESDELFPKFEMLYQKSTFKEKAGKKFEKYSKKCTKPMTEAGGSKDIHLYISLESLITSSASVLHVIEKSRSLLSHTDT